MRPLVRTEVFRMRTAPNVKEAIRQRANEMDMTQTAYIEMLVSKDVNQDEEHERKRHQEKNLT